MFSAQAVSFTPRLPHSRSPIINRAAYTKNIIECQQVQSNKQNSAIPSTNITPTSKHETSRKDSECKDSRELSQCTKVSISP